MPVVANLTTMQLADLFAPSQTNFCEILSCITAKWQEYCRRVQSEFMPVPVKCLLWDKQHKPSLSIQVSFMGKHSKHCINIDHHRQTSCSDIVCFPYTQFSSSLKVYVSLLADDKLSLSVVLELISAFKWCLWLKRLFCHIDFLLPPSYYKAENSYIAVFDSLFPLGFT